MAARLRILGPGASGSTGTGPPATVAGSAGHRLGTAAAAGGPGEAGHASRATTATVPTHLMIQASGGTVGTTGGGTAGLRLAPAMMETVGRSDSATVASALAVGRRSSLQPATGGSATATGGARRPSTSAAGANPTTKAGRRQSSSTSTPTGPPPGFGSFPGTPLPQLPSTETWSVDDIRNVLALHGYSSVAAATVIDLHSTTLATAVPLAMFRRAEVLFLHENRLTDIRPLLELTRLRKLDLAFNNISILPLASEWKALRSLQILYLHNNHIEDKAQVLGLSSLPSLIRITLHGNPIAKQEGYRSFVIRTVPRLIALDHFIVSDAELFDGPIRFPDKFAPLSVALRVQPPQYHPAATPEQHRLATRSELVNLYGHYRACRPAVKLQRLFRGFRHRRWLRRRLKYGDSAATRIQKWVRTFLWKLDLYADLEELMKDAEPNWNKTSMQLKRTEAATAIQKWWRTWGFQVELNQAAAVITRCMRRWLVLVQDTLTWFQRHPHVHTLFFSPKHTTVVVTAAAAAGFALSISPLSPPLPWLKPGPKTYACHRARQPLNRGPRPDQAAMTQWLMLNVVPSAIQCWTQPNPLGPSQVLFRRLISAYQQLNGTRMVDPPPRVLTVTEQLRSMNAELCRLLRVRAPRLDRSLVAHFHNIRGLAAANTTKAIAAVGVSARVSLLRASPMMAMLVLPSSAHTARTLIRLRFIEAKARRGRSRLLQPGVWTTCWQDGTVGACHHVDQVAAAVAIQSTWRSHKTRTSLRPSPPLLVATARAATALQRWFRGRSVRYRMGMLHAVAAQSRAVDEQYLFIEEPVFRALLEISPEEPDYPHGRDPSDMEKEVWNASGHAELQKILPVPPSRVQRPGLAVSGKLKAPAPAVVRPWHVPYMPEHEIQMCVINGGLRVIQPKFPPGRWMGLRVGLPVWLGWGLQWIKAPPPPMATGRPSSASATHSFQQPTIAYGVRALLTSGVEIQPVNGPVMDPLGVLPEAPDWGQRQVRLLRLKFQSVEEARARACLLLAWTWHASSQCGATLFTYAQVCRAWRDLNAPRVDMTKLPGFKFSFAAPKWALPSKWSLRFAWIGWRPFDPMHVSERSKSPPVTIIRQLPPSPIASPRRAMSPPPTTSPQPEPHPTDRQTASPPTGGRSASPEPPTLADPAKPNFALTGAALRPRAMSHGAKPAPRAPKRPGTGAPRPTPRHGTTTQAASAAAAAADSRMPPVAAEDSRTSADMLRGSSTGSWTTEGRPSTAAVWRVVDQGGHGEDDDVELEFGSEFEPLQPHPNRGSSAPARSRVPELDVGRIQAARGGAYSATGTRPLTAASQRSTVQQQRIEQRQRRTMSAAQHQLEKQAALRKVVLEKMLNESKLAAADKRHEDQAQAYAQKIVERRQAHDQKKASREFASQFSSVNSMITRHVSATRSKLQKEAQLEEAAERRRMFDARQQARQAYAVVAMEGKAQESRRQAERQREEIRLGLIQQQQRKDEELEVMRLRREQETQMKVIQAALRTAAAEGTLSPLDLLLGDFGGQDSSVHTIPRVEEEEDAADDLPPAVTATMADVHTEYYQL